MDKKKLDGGSFENEGRWNDAWNGLTHAQRQYVLQMIEEGYDFDPNYYNESDNNKLEGWQWSRKKPDWNGYNYKTRDELIAEQIDAFRAYYSSVQAPPGTSSNGISQDGYNMYARWDLWPGGYVQNMGFVAAPTSSMEYGASLLRNNSWIPQGNTDAPLPVVKYYRLDQGGKWKGGHVSGWGYVNEDTHVLGASTSIRFTLASHAYDWDIINIVNLSMQISNWPLDIDSVRSEFMKYWDQQTHRFEIDDRTLRKYLNDHFYQATTTSIPEALDKHYGVLLRLVTRTVEVNGQELKYGYDVLVLGYNPVLQQYLIFGTNGTLDTLDALKINRGETDVIKFIYYQKNA